MINQTFLQLKTYLIEHPERLEEVTEEELRKNQEREGKTDDDRDRYLLYWGSIGTVRS